MSLYLSCITKLKPRLRLEKLVLRIKNVMGHLILVSKVILVISADFSFWTSFRALNNFSNVMYIVFPGDDLKLYVQRTCLNLKLIINKTIKKSDTAQLWFKSQG